MPAATMEGKFADTLVPLGTLIPLRLGDIDRFNDAVAMISTFFNLLADSESNGHLYDLIAAPMDDLIEFKERLNQLHELKNDAEIQRQKDEAVDATPRTTKKQRGAA